MEKSEKKEYLSEYIWIDRRIQMIDRELQHTILYNVGCNGKKAETDEVKYILKKEQLDNKKKELLRKKERIEKAVQAVQDNLERIMLHSMYINGMTAMEISSEMHISERTVYQIIDDAVNRMDV